MSQARVFRCPRCREFIATDARSCRFCRTPIDARAAQSAADAQEVENKQYRRKQYARHMLTGGGLFLLGVVVTAGTLGLAASARGGGQFVIMYGLVFYGAGDFLYGLVGWLGELRK